MTQHQILVSTYSDGIYTLVFDDAKGSLDVVSEMKVGHHPSWITRHPCDRSIVFTGLEQSDGVALALRFDGVGRGEVIGRTGSGGQDPCSLLATKDELLIANYSSGTIGIVSLSDAPPYILPSLSAKRIQLVGSGPNKSRQEASHPHQVAILDDYQELLVPDLGADQVRRFRKSADGSWTPHGHVQHEPGAGPRHIAYYNGELFTLLELSSQIVRHVLPPLPALPKFVTATPTMSSLPPLPHDMLAAEILIPHPNITFSTPYIYVSNRNDPSPGGDIISIFDFTSDPSTLRLIAEVRTGLEHVRGILFGGEDEKFLAVGGANGGGVKMFERIDGGRGLKEIAVNVGVNAPTGFLWM